MGLSKMVVPLGGVRTSCGGMLPGAWAGNLQPKQTYGNCKKPQRRILQDLLLAISAVNGQL